MPQTPPPSLFAPDAVGRVAAQRSGAPTASLADGALFSDGKAADALRTIGEVALALGIRQHVLRYWEDQFPMLRPLKRSGSRRYYRPADIALVREIDRLVHRQGYTLRGARLALEGKGDAPAAAGRTAETPAAPARAPAMDAGVVDRLKAIRARLAAAAG